MCHFPCFSFCCVAAEEEAGFPLSSYLRQAGFSLGRNARMLASQAPDRMADRDKVKINTPAVVVWCYCCLKLDADSGMNHIDIHVACSYL